MSQEAWIIDAVRTPRGIGKQEKGALAHIHPQRLASTVLKAVAERVRSTLRQPDKAYRLGGDEFAVLLEDSRENNPQRLAERLLAALVQPLALNGERIDFVTPSIGIALYPRHAGDAEGLVRAADSAMYQAKRQRNRYCLYRAQA